MLTLWPLRRHLRRWRNRIAVAVMMLFALLLPWPLRQRLLGQSVLRRVVLTAVSMSFLLVWCALMAYNYVRSTDDTERAKHYVVFGQGMLNTLATSDSAEQASGMVRAFADRINESRQLNNLPGDFKMQLWDRQTEKLVFASDALHRSPWPMSSEPLTTGSLSGQAHFFFHGHTQRWTLGLAEPNVGTPWLLWRVAKDLLPNLLIAFPLTVLPLWLAVAYGLRPLRRLSEHIAQRDADDLSGLGLNSPYKELRPLEKSLDGLMARLSSKIQREHAFVQDAAHELRTPLAVISAQAHVLAKSQTPADRQEAQARLDEAIARASHLVQQLLTLAQVESGQQVPLEEVDVAQVIRETIAQCASLPRQPAVEMSLEAPDHCPQTVNRLALTSVLNNLLDNALKHGASANDMPRVHLQLSQGAGHWQLSVADNGPGIPTAEQAQVFERFHRRAGQDLSGAGLGLAIVKEAASRLGGEVTVSPGLEGRGCCFLLRVPTPSLKPVESLTSRHPGGTE